MSIRLNTKSAPVQVVIQYSSGMKLTVAFNLSVAANLGAGSASLQTLSNVLR